LSQLDPPDSVKRITKPTKEDAFKRIHAGLVDAALMRGAAPVSTIELLKSAAASTAEPVKSPEGGATGSTTAAVDPAVKEMIESIEKGDVDGMKAAVAAGVKITDPLTQNGSIALHLAAYHGKLEAVTFLLGKLGTEVDARRPGGATALLLAAQRGHLDVVSLLLESGADVDAETAYGYTPLMMSAGLGHVKIVELLLENGAAADAVNTKGHTAEDVAREHKKPEVVSLLSNLPAATAATATTLEPAPEPAWDPKPVVLSSDSESDSEDLATTSVDPTGVGVTEDEKKYAATLKEEDYDFTKQRAGGASQKDADFVNTAAEKSKIRSRGNVAYILDFTKKQEPGKVGLTGRGEANNFMRDSDAEMFVSLYTAFRPYTNIYAADANYKPPDPLKKPTKEEKTAAKAKKKQDAPVVKNIEALSKHIKTFMSATGADRIGSRQLGQREWGEHYKKLDGNLTLTEEVGVGDAAVPKGSILLKIADTLVSSASRRECNYIWHDMSGGLTDHPKVSLEVTYLMPAKKSAHIIKAGVEEIRRGPELAEVFAKEVVPIYPTGVSTELAAEARVVPSAVAPVKAVKAAAAPVKAAEAPVKAAAAPVKAAAAPVSSEGLWKKTYEMDQYGEDLPVWKNTQTGAFSYTEPAELAGTTASLPTATPPATASLPTATRPVAAEPAVARDVPPPISRRGSGSASGGSGSASGGSGSDTDEGGI